MSTDDTTPVARPHWQRVLWLLGGGLSLVTGIVGAFLPVLPTTPFVLLAAFCFSRGCARCERWLLEHRRFGPMVHDWRAHRSVPLRAKQLAVVMMTVGSAWSWWTLPSPYRWLPGLLCLAVGTWLVRLPTARPRPAAAPRHAAPRSAAGAGPAESGPPHSEPRP